MTIKTKRTKLFRISFKITIMVICLIIISTSVIGVISYYNYRDRSIDMLSDNLVYVAQSAAALIDPTEYREIMASREKNDYHHRLANRYVEMAAIHGVFAIHAGEIDPNAGFLGFVGPSELGADLGDMIPGINFPQEAFDAMTHGVAYKTPPVIAEDYNVENVYGGIGIVLGAYAPVFDENGNTIAIVSATLVDSSIYANSRNFAMRMTGIVLITIFVLIWIPIIFTRRVIGIPISKLSAATNAIVNGDLSGEIKIKSNDELGVLSDNFTIMQASIREKMEAERAAHQAELARGQAEAVADAMRESITYASKIQRDLLPPGSAMAAAFEDCSVIWEPRDIVGGDIYWMKKFDAGTVLCVADCTGHGTPGALLTMLVTSALDTIVSQDNCSDTAEIVFMLDQRLSGALHTETDESGRSRIMDINDGCDIAVLFISNDGSVTFSSGKIPVFVCDGKEIAQFKGQKIFIGEGKLSSKDEVIIHNIQTNPKNKFYISSDGLFDQIGGQDSKQFGYETFKQIILKNHSENQAVIIGKVWDAFEEYRGEQARRDDFELVAFKP